MKHEEPYHNLKYIQSDGIKKETIPTIPANYLHLIPDSHRYTLYGLQQELKYIEETAVFNKWWPIVHSVREILIGIENSIKAGTDQSTVI